MFRFYWELPFKLVGLSSLKQALKMMQRSCLIISFSVWICQSTLDVQCFKTKCPPTPISTEMPENCSHFKIHTFKTCDWILVDSIQSNIFKVLGKRIHLDYFHGSSKNILMLPISLNFFHVHDIAWQNNISLYPTEDRLSNF